MAHAIDLPTEIDRAQLEEAAAMATIDDLLAAPPPVRARLWPDDVSGLYALTYAMMARPTDLAGARRIIALSDDFPADGRLPYQDMRRPIREVVVKRLKAAGIDTAALEAELAASGRDLPETGYAKTA